MIYAMKRQWAALGTAAFTKAGPRSEWGAFFGKVSWPATGRDKAHMKTTSSNI